NAPLSRLVSSRLDSIVFPPLDFLAACILLASAIADQHTLPNNLLVDSALPQPQRAMTNEQPLFRITREGLRDGSLIAAARGRMAAGMQVRTDAEIAACLDAILTEH